MVFQLNGLVNLPTNLQKLLITKFIYLLYKNNLNKKLEVKK